MPLQTDKLLDLLDSAETVGAEIASKIAPWLAPLLSAIIVSQAVTHAPFAWPIWQSILLGATLELMGLATLSTLMMLYSYRQRQPDDRKPSLFPLVLAGGGVAVYVGTVASITVLLKLPSLAVYAETVSVLVYTGILLLAITAAVNLTIRRDHYRLLNQVTTRKMAQTTRRRRPVNKRPADQTNDERRANLTQANAARQPTQADYNRAAHLRDEGLTWREVANQIGRSESTAKTWAKRAVQPAQISTNGHH